ASTGPTIRHSFLENIHAPNSAWAATRLAIQPQWTSIVLSRVDLIPPNALDYHRDIAKRLNRRSDRYQLKKEAEEAAKKAEEAKKAAEEKAKKEAEEAAKKAAEEEAKAEEKAKLEKCKAAKTC
ncbi:hypothetical protein N0V91_010785, partial [Didymella pomorum]